MSNWETAIYMLVGLIIGVIVHEYMHGYVAYRMGDTTAKRAGRLTLDPLAHIDLLGTIILPGVLLLMRIMGFGVFIFGYAKPVPINPFLFRKPRAIIWVSLAGPLSNLLLSFILIGIAGIVNAVWDSSTAEKVVTTLVYMGYINVILFVFNLIPIPPLDGSRILGYFLRGEVKRIYTSLEPFGFFIIIAIISFFGVILYRPVQAVLDALLRLFGLQ